jgi:hypothetical protein
LTITNSHGHTGDHQVRGEEKLALGEKIAACHGGSAVAARLNDITEKELDEKVTIIFFYIITKKQKQIAIHILSGAITSNLQCGETRVLQERLAIHALVDEHFICCEHTSHRRR